MEHGFRYVNTLRGASSCEVFLSLWLLAWAAFTRIASRRKAFARLVAIALSLCSRFARLENSRLNARSLHFDFERKGHERLDAVVFLCLSRDCPASFVCDSPKLSGFSKEFAMNLLVYALLPFDDIDCWPRMVICGILIMVITVAAQLLFNPEARSKRKIDKVRQDLDPSYWGSYEP